METFEFTYKNATERGNVETTTKFAADDDIYLDEVVGNINNFLSNVFGYQVVLTRGEGS